MEPSNSSSSSFIHSEAFLDPPFPPSILFGLDVRPSVPRRRRLQTFGNAEIGIYGRAAVASSSLRAFAEEDGKCTRRKKGEDQRWVSASSLLPLPHGLKYATLSLFLLPPVLFGRLSGRWILLLLRSLSPFLFSTRQATKEGKAISPSSPSSFVPLLSLSPMERDWVGRCQFHSHSAGLENQQWSSSLFMHFFPFTLEQEGTVFLLPLACRIKHSVCTVQPVYRDQWNKRKKKGRRVGGQAIKILLSFLGRRRRRRSLCLSSGCSSSNCSLSSPLPFLLPPPPRRRVCVCSEMSSQ